MNKNLMILGVVILLLLAGGGIFLATSKKSATEADLTAIATVSPSKAPIANTGKSLKDLLTSNQSQSCTFSNVDLANVNGTVYISGGKIRGDFLSVIPNKTVITHMIADGKNSYVWMDNETKGFKMAYDPQTQPTGQPTYNSNPLDANKRMDYNCSGWDGDASKFLIPTSVQFSDLGALTIPTVSTSGAPTMDKCSACNYLSGDVKTQCLTALKCN